MGRWDALGLAMWGIFGVGLVVLVQRFDAEQKVIESALSSSPELQPGVEWLGVYAGSEKVGYTRTERQRTDDGWHLEVQSVMRLSMMSVEQHLELEVDAYTDDALTLKRFTFSVDAGPAELSGEGEVEGVAPDLTLKLTLDTAGSESTRLIPLSRPPALQATLGPALGQRTLIPGETFTLGLFDPITQQEQAVEIEVVGPETISALGQIVETTRIKQRIGGLVLDAWLNPRGEILKQQLAMGMVAIRETEAQARWGVSFGPQKAVDLFEKTLIKVDDMPGDIRKRNSLALSLSGISFQGLDLDGDRQRFDPQTGKLEIHKEPPPTGLKLPTTLNTHLEATALIQADHPDIVALAREITEGRDDTVQVATDISKWLKRHITQQRVIGVPSALEVLKTRVGDCNEHSVLFAALARARGVPTRVVAGLVWFVPRSEEGRFGYHAWNEIAVQGPDGHRWHTVDATWNQMPADVGHVRLVVGDLGRQVELLRAIGQLVIERAPTP
ncbi:MAG: transglutaminase-like domain-containing protein [Bradymonadia bacterium]